MIEGRVKFKGDKWGPWFEVNEDFLAGSWVTQAFAISQASKITCEFSAHKTQYRAKDTDRDAS